MSRAQHHILGALAVILTTAGALVPKSGDPAAAQRPDQGVTASIATHPENPPPAYTGGFGEPTCAECHFDSDVNAGGGTLSVHGLPDRILAGSTHSIEIRLAHPDMAVGGFMLSVRTADGAQAGTLHAGNGRTTITMADDVAYAHHTRTGTAAADAAATWTVQWTADGLSAGDSVHFHVVANAGNDDESPFGDFIYATSRQVPVASGEKSEGG